MDGREGNQEIYVRTADMNTQAKGAEFRITNSETFDDNPSLCWTGGEFAVAWIHESKSKFDLMFQKLDAQGKPRGNPGAIVRQAMLGKDTVLAWTGAGYGLVDTEYMGDVGQGDLVFRYLDDTGKLTGSPVTLAAEPGNKIAVAMLRAGSDFMLFYFNETSRSVHHVMLDPFGQPRGAPAQMNDPGTVCGLPAAAFNGSFFVAAWPQETGAVKDIMVKLVGSSGIDLGTPYPITTPDQDRTAVTVAAGPNGFGTAWIGFSEEGRALFFRALDRDGKPLSEPIRLSKPRQIKKVGSKISMEPDNAGYVIAWVDVAPPMNTEIILSRVAF
jgi:hypothetical protein